MIEHPTDGPLGAHASLPLVNDRYGRKRIGESLENESPIFLFASGERCGSTLVQRFLNTHPSVMLWGEQGGALEALSLCFQLASEHDREYGKTREMFFESLEDSFIANLNPGGHALRNAGQAFLLRYFAGFSSLWGCKEIRCGTDVAERIAWLFPKARFIFLTRHIENCLKSLSRFDLPVAEVESFALRWSRIGRQFAQVPESIAGTSKLVRYEEFTIDPEAAARRLATWLGLSYEDFDSDVLQVRIPEPALRERIEDAPSRDIALPDHLLSYRRRADVQEVLSLLGYG